MIAKLASKKKPHAHSWKSTIYNRAFRHLALNSDKVTLFNWHRILCVHWGLIRIERIQFITKYIILTRYQFVFFSELSIAIILIIALILGIVILTIGLLYLRRYVDTISEVVNSELKSDISIVFNLYSHYFRILATQEL